MLKEGLYVGAAAGIDSYRTAYDVDFVTPEGVLISADPKMSDFGGVIGAFVGYGRYFDYKRLHNLYLGLEVFANGSSAQTDAELKTVADTVPRVEVEIAPRAQSNWGISVLPGIRLNLNTLFYVRLGYGWANLSVDESVLVGPTEIEDHNKAITRGGFNYGLGVEAAFYDRWTARAEMNHTDYNDFDTRLGSKLKMADTQFMLGMIYHIDFNW
jgi:opacity protein-like surface antigen